MKSENKFYHDNGYLVIERLFDANDVKQAHNAINEILKNNSIDKVFEFESSDGETIRRIWSPIKRHHFFRDMSESNKLLSVVSGLIGNNLILQYSKLNMKGPKVGSIVEWHQDFSYYPHTNADLLSCLIYLDDATEENGCLEVIPGSHKLGLLDHDIDGYFRGPENITPLLPKKVSLVAPAGSVIFLHCLTLHFSNVNRSDKPRRAFLPAYRAADSFPIYYGSHAAHNEADAKLVRGQKSKVARSEPATWRLPFPESAFNSLYEIQEGSHLKQNDVNKVSGYYAKV
jgi:ectoine hydroxylase-related dioxygenase (phytanoyl-CoA dioxygenase family)